MNLPSDGIQWSDYRNVTPTFDLTPIEKPDLSPFLIHMTGRNSLYSILKGQDKGKASTSGISEGNGFLQAVIPSVDWSSSYYNAKVVCFTETPIFALDFFRYRSFRRWSDDQRYGIGFSKSDLIRNHNIRPVIYLDSETNTQVLSLCNKILNDDLRIVDSNSKVLDMKELFSKIKPLLFPMLEDTEMQGFMWEREWRCSNEVGMVFPYKSIRVICCPKSEKGAIEEVLGDLKGEIEIVESWREYDEVTHYLRRRNKEDALVEIEISAINDIELLKELKSKNEQTRQTLESYYEVFKETVTSLENWDILDFIVRMKQKTKEIDNQLKILVPKQPASPTISRETAEKIKRMLNEN